MEIIGYDTETYKGYVKLLADSKGEYIETDNSERLLEFLDRTSTDNGFNVFYNIEYDLGSIIKQYVVINGDKYHKDFYERMKIKLIGKDEDEDDGYKFIIGKYTIRYLKDKMFSLKRGNKIKYFWDASNFYKDGYSNMQLGYLVKTYLNDSKNDEELGIDRAKIGSQEGYYEDNRAKIIKYCVKDCNLTKRLFELTIDSFNRLGFNFPDKPYSQASIFKEYIKPIWGDEKKYAVYSQEDSHFNFWYNSYRGGLFKTEKIGYYKGLYDIDINSAYPYFMSKMYSIVDYEITDDERTADYSFYKIRTKPFRFLPLRTKNRLIYGKSNNEFTFFITEYDKEILDTFNHPYTVVDYIGIKTHKKLAMPFINELFVKKSEIKKQYGSKSIEYHNIKVLINGGYGALVQQVPHFTKMTNFVYGSYITSYCRYRIAQLVKMIENHSDNVLQIATDGILLRSDNIDYLKPFISDNLGALSFKKWKNAVIYGNGIALLSNDYETSLKRRGFEKMTINDLRQNQLSINYKSYKPLRILSSIIQKKYDNLNDFVQVEKTFSPYEIWRNHNPQFAESLIDTYISDFWNIQKNVKELDIDKYSFLLKGDNE